MRIPQLIAHGAIALQLTTSTAFAAWFEVDIESKEGCTQLPNEQSPEQAVQVRVGGAKVQVQKKNLPDGAILSTHSATVSGERKIYTFASMHGACMIQTMINEAAESKNFQAALRKKYISRINFKTAEARKIVNAFNIDCRMQDGRYIPLINILSVRLQQFDKPDSWLETIVDSRGGEVRISDFLQNKSAPQSQPRLSYQINKWGELVPVGTTIEALMNACHGGYGKIWVIP